MSMAMSQASTARRTGAQARRVWRVMRIIAHVFYGFWLALRYRAWRDPYRPALRPLVRQWMRDLLDVLSVEVRVRGRIPCGTNFVVSNHVSWLDIPVIGAALEVHFLSKAEVRDWPAIGMLASAAGTLFIRRGSGDAQARSRDIAGHLQAGRSVLVFPEGTTTTGDSVRRFFPRLFDAPCIAGTPVQPVTIRYPDEYGDADPQLAFVGDDALHHHLWALLLRDRILVDLTFGEPLVVAGQERDALCQAAHQAVQSPLT